MGVNDDAGEVVIDELEGETRQTDHAELNTARQEDLKHAYKIGLYERAPAEERWRDMGKPPIEARWVDVIQNSDGEALIRTTLVARDSREKGGKLEGVFAAILPLDALNYLLVLSLNPLERRGEAGDGNQYAVAPEERKNPRKCWKFKKLLHWMKPVGRACEEDCADRAGMLNMVRGKAAPACSWGEGCRARVRVHGDDFVVARPARGMGRLKKSMKDWYDVKVRAALRWDMERGRVGGGREAQNAD